MVSAVTASVAVVVVGSSVSMVAVGVSTPVATAGSGPTGIWTR